MFSQLFQNFPLRLRRTWLLIGLCVLLGLVGIVGVDQHVQGQSAMPSTPTAVTSRPGGNGKPTVVPSPPATAQPSPTAAQPSPTAAQPSPTPVQPTPSPTASPQQSPLALDTFARPDQALWGTSSDGNTWEGDANQPDMTDAFSIANQQGTITGLGPQGQTVYFNALLGMPASDVDVLVVGAVQQFDGQDNLGVLARWSDGNHWYKALIDGTQLAILLRAGDTNMQIASVPFAAQDGTSYTLRFRVVGATLSARVWQTGTPEPQDWMVTVTDSTLTTGQVGLRVVLHDTNTIDITSFVADTVNNPAS